MNEKEQNELITMAEKQFQKIKASNKFADKTKAFNLMQSLLETYLGSIND